MTNEDIIETAFQVWGSKKYKTTNLKSIADAWKYLKEVITLEMLDQVAHRYTDNEMAEKVQLERERLFAKIVAA